MALAMPVQADIYGHTDEEGTLHLSNYPTDERDVLLQKDPASATTSPQAPPLATQPYAPQVEEAARRHEVEPALLHAVITAESAYNPRAVSPKGAAGLMQLMPATARRLGVDNVYDPDQNIQGGARYLKELLQRFDNDLSLTLAAYNAGEQAVARYGNRVPPYRETRGYVAKVLGLYRKYGRLLP
jgi:soluble lytic murein transglycosylase-like protein